MVGVSHPERRESTIPRGPWQNAAMPPPDISTSDGDLLGLRYLSGSAMLTRHMKDLEDTKYVLGQWCQGLGLVKWFHQNPLQLPGFIFLSWFSWISDSIEEGKGFLYYSFSSLLPPPSSQGPSFLQSSHRGVLSCTIT